MRNGLPVYQDEQITRAMEECRCRNGLAIDGGAHVGLWTLRLVRHFREVWGFEPQPQNFDCLKANVAGIDNVKILNVALGEIPGQALLTGFKEKTFGWRLGVSPGNTSIEVQTIRLDDLNLDVDLLKLDIEGGEYDALLGSEETLLRCRPVVVIEEKLDALERASRYLESLGMWCVYEARPDRIYVWE